MSQSVIVDGYNVIYTDERLRRTACKDLERARDGLVEKLESYLSGRKLKITVVFDGRGGMASAEAVIPGKLQVVYSAGSETADEVIVETLRKATNPAAHIVVTSDMADIGRAARALGCQVIGSKRFLDRMEADGKRVRSAGAGPAVDLGDTDYWLEKFAADGETEGET
ncbi:MAG: NYN domain-containing protein [Candidatus Krumholzibacteriia bacterium]